MNNNLTDRIKQNFNACIQTQIAALEFLPKIIADAGKKMAEAIKNGNKILTCGNGGSASDAQHITGELLNRFLIDRPPLPAIALTADTSSLTAIANDFNYAKIFAFKINALGNKGDILLAITTSGNSENIVEAIKAAHAKKLCVIALTGRDGGEVTKLLDSKNDIEIRVPVAKISPRIQETHILIIHCLCDLIDHILFEHKSHQEA